MKSVQTAKRTSERSTYKTIVVSFRYDCEKTLQINQAV